mmetsp:Transcript_20587/g.45080  ORF Transcript_20587/g.45080 Transcript_20587/m.45080 type:complete len:978 (-) Transcript_20587:2385-5318(-)|eukprot:CAMPEP_0202902634 /NCGR_PEP_ID=MMETSP1392-20130828/16965_1 /ASSEMBLY_ACC=CAM_ASM_000868 /TAXON_ID=225041 /ORGANISM="Chlamydomonas chlamydogama, Strain SAG 11-48b" /LENGTH=977 /DNA_ID=CAMNT_0049589427 /DNA_START=280 /DNA_END=3213 /DNA_ORIENTATION=+
MEPVLPPWVLRPSAGSPGHSSDASFGPSSAPHHVGMRSHHQQQQQVASVKQPALSVSANYDMSTGMFGAYMEHRERARGSEGELAGAMHYQQRGTGQGLDFPAYNRMQHVAPGGRPSATDDDIFSTVGGFEVGHDADVDHHLEQAAATSQLPDPTAEPSRTLLVRNIAPDAADDELSSIFQSFGDVRTLFTSSKHRGLVVVSYYDVRAAVSAKNTLQGTLVRGLPLEIHFSAPKQGTQDVVGLNQGTIVVFNLDPDTTNEHLVWLFSKFGDVRGISESPHRANQKFITFFDIRHAAAALKAMNRAEHLGKLPGHITPQQAASMAHLTSSSNELLQLAASQLQAESQVGGGDASVEGLLNLVNQQHGFPPGQGQHPSSHLLGGDAQIASAAMAKLGKFSVDMANTRASLHISDSASSIASNPNSTASQLLAAASGGPMVMGAGKGLAGSMAAAAAAAAAARNNGAGGPSGMDPSASGVYQHGHNAAAAAAAAVDRQAQQLLVQSGMSAADAAAAANMLMSLNLSSSMGSGDASQAMWGAQGQMNAQPGQPGSGNWAGRPMYGNPQNNAAAAAAAAMANQLAGLQELQAQQNRQQQQQQQVAAVAAAAMQAQHQQQQQHLALVNQLAGLQAQQALAVANAGGVGVHNQLAAAQLLQAAQLNQALGNSSLFPHHALANSAAAAQLLQQAGLGMPGLAALAAGQASLLGRGGNAALLSQLGAGAGLAASRSGGGSADNVRGGGRLSRRTNDPIAEAERKAQQEKLYALDMEKILGGEDKRTTLMIKNIPNKYTQKMLLATIDEHFRGTYDFFYLPIDFKNKCNVGYAFINMIQPIHIIALVERFNHKKWERFNSEKVCNISYARIQGRQALVNHFQNSSLMHEDKRCRPILFTVDGHEPSEQDLFASSNHGGSSSSLASLATSGGPVPSAEPSSVGAGPSKTNGSGGLPGSGSVGNLKPSSSSGSLHSSSSAAGSHARILK